ncbi:hypothetical protein J5226_22015 [Lysobacter sp. K5869]|uniref:hypothetical protein n=1 Tax=Lysobacter sp. K5869 TaxID=2820808 RepID=UPI001C064755|nr:hypothetical protein [Lysobacter sp. K5869]QWP76233.1 hypothetical protein J5226_22015 [Lysobacter sp. K5869]
MTSIPAPYAVTADALAQRWWVSLSGRNRDALMRSWADDERADPLRRIARRTADYLNDWVMEYEQPRDPIARELLRRGAAACLPCVEPAGWSWGMQDLYEYHVGHADISGRRLDQGDCWDNALPETRMGREPTETGILASGSWWAL